jgi:hypothetical protein
MPARCPAVQLDIVYVDGDERLPRLAQWLALTIARTRLALGLFSLITLFAHQILESQELAVRQATRFQKRLTIFSDTVPWCGSSFG